MRYSILNTINQISLSRNTNEKYDVVLQTQNLEVQIRFCHVSLKVPNLIADVGGKWNLGPTLQLINFL